MNPILLSGFGVCITVNMSCLTVGTKGSINEFRLHHKPYDFIINVGHYGSVSFEAMRWLSKHTVSVTSLNWNDNILYITTLTKITLNVELELGEYVKYISHEPWLYIATQFGAVCSYGDNYD